LATANPSHLERSKDALIDDLTIADRIGAEGVIVHVGSHKGRGFETVIDQIVNSINQIFLEAESNASLILENSAGTGDKIGAKFEELGEIIKACGSKQIKICLDTQLTFASGYPIHQKDGLEKALLEFDQEVGIDNLAVIHANDSKVPFLTANDRHENIGEGYIGKEGFGIILANPIMKKLPFILETPGFDNLGPDKRNIEILKQLVEK
jgi:deoxyribonuclease-4